MKKFLSLIVLWSMITAWCEANEINFDKIALTPYIESVNKQDGVANNFLKNKLNQAVLKCGMVGQGLDDRFIITAHASEIERVPTATTPVKYALKIMLTIYVGDGIDGMLFSNYAVELKGVGASLDEAYLSAYRKLSINDPALLESIETGRQRIIDYYNQHAPDIIAHARALAKKGDFDQAIYQLFLIPPMCNDYEQAQNLAGSFATEACDKANELILSDARAAWAASPDENGAREAQRLLSQLSNPSDHIVAKSKTLSGEIAARLKHVEDKRIAREEQRERHEQQMERQRERHAHQQNMAAIGAAASVEKTRIRAARDVAVSYYQSRPRVTYHVHWW